MNNKIQFRHGSDFCFFLNPTRLQIFGLTFQLSGNKEIQLTDNFFNSLLPFMAYSGNALISIGELFYDKPG